MTWQLPGGGDAGQLDTETSFLVKICGVVQRLIIDERRVLLSINDDIRYAAVANHYVSVAVANAGLRVHAAVHRLVTTTLQQHSDDLCTETHWSSVVGQLRRNASLDLPLLADIRKLAFRARLEQVDGLQHCSSSTWVVADIDRDEAAARNIISEQVDRVVKHHSRTVRENMERCDVLTLARFGAALSNDLSRSTTTHDAVLDTLTNQLWTSAIDTACLQLAQRLSTISTLNVGDAVERVSQWLGNLSRSTVLKVNTETYAW